MSASVSLTMIVKNEEANLPACMASVAGLFHEIIVVDTGSTDRTRELAAHLGARVFDFAWIDDFAAARNEALRHAAGEWIFWLDADDRIDEVNRSRLQPLLAGLGNENVAYRMKSVCESPAESGSASVVEHARLFRQHPEIRWKYRIHEQIAPAIERLGGVQRSTDVTIQHAGYRDPVVRRHKLERDLRLLQLENSEHPDDALILFHLGYTWHLMGNAVQALPMLWRCVQAAPANLAIVRKAQVLVVRSLRQVGDREQALRICQHARSLYPHDVELCFHHGQLLKERRDFPAAEACLRQLLQMPADQHMAIGDDPALRGSKGRCALAEVYRDSGRLDEAEAQYRRVVAEQPDFTLAWLCLADVLLSRGLWQAAEQVAADLAALPGGSGHAMLLRARGHMARKEFTVARQLAEQAIALSPQAVWPREVLTHVLVMERRDWPAAERALRDLLALQPNNSGALANLAMVQRELGLAKQHRAIGSSRRS